MFFIEKKKKGILNLTIYETVDLPVGKINKIDKHGCMQE
jgi:hypothetical protein